MNNESYTRVTLSNLAALLARANLLSLSEPKWRIKGRLSRGDSSYILKIYGKYMKRDAMF
jgi:hypothetical protein